MGDQGLQELSRHGLIPDIESGVSEVCKPYQMSKQKRVQFAISTARSATPLELVPTDVWGPTSILARNGVKYVLTLIDDFSRKVYVYFLRKKSDVFSKFKV